MLISYRPDSSPLLWPLGLRLTGPMKHFSRCKNILKVIYVIFESLQLIISRLFTILLTSIVLGKSVISNDWCPRVGLNNLSIQFYWLVCLYNKPKLLSQRYYFIYQANVICYFFANDKKITNKKIATLFKTSAKAIKFTSWKFYSVEVFNARPEPRAVLGTILIHETWGGHGQTFFQDCGLV